MVLRISFAARNVLLHKHVDSNAVFGVHHDGGAIVAGLLHRTKNLSIVTVENTWVSHE